MTSQSQDGPAGGPANPHCLLHTVSRVMAEEPALEAVTVDRGRGRVALATLGPTRASDLSERLVASIQAAREAAEHPCGLLEGAPDCTTCDRPTPASEQRRFTIAHDAEKTTIAKVTCPTAPKFWRWRDLPLPKVVPREVVIPEDERQLNEWKPQLAAAALCGALALAGASVSDPRWSLGCYLLAYLAGAWFQVEEVWEHLQRRSLDVHFLMLVVALGSASIGAWGEGATLLFLFSLSGALEHYALGRTQREIRALFKSAPKVATLLEADGAEREVPVDRLRPGQRLLVKPDALFPVDAEIVQGRTASDESNLTGEATPVEKGVGDTVLAGTLNLWGVVQAVVLRPVQQSALEKIVRLIREAQHLKAPSQRFTDRFGSGYTYGVLVLTLGMFFVWWLGFGHAPFRSGAGAGGRSAFYRAMTLLVVASPCALVLSIPSAVLAAIAWGARRGVLFRGGAAVEKLAEVDVVALDKTGTLTTGELQVARVESYPAGREGEVASLAYSLERLSTHPLARAITRHGKQQQLPVVALEQFESVPGLGLRAQHRGQAVWLGRREWLQDRLKADGGADGGLARTLAGAPGLDPGYSEVWVVRDGLLGRVLLRDDVRPQARGVIAQLRRAGLTTVVLTGDQPATAELLRTQLGLDDVRAGLKPEEKVAAVAAFTRQGRRVVMVGDGVNDAPSLAAAHVGVAMGARGSDAALEQAEIVLMHDRLENVLAAFCLSRQARRVIRQNLVVSLGTVTVLVGCALAGAIPLTVGVVGHEGSTVVVVLNSLRLLFARCGATRAQAETACAGCRRSA